MQQSNILTWVDEISEQRRRAIRCTPDTVQIPGVTYYVSSSGCDDNDGKSPSTPWKTPARVSLAPLCPGDGVRFRRGDLFRGGIEAKEGVTYAAYGEGDKPKIYGWCENLADGALWELYDAEHHIYKYKKRISDCGTLVFNEGERHSRKLIPSYMNGVFVCRDDESRPFAMSEQMTRDLDLYTPYDERLTQQPSKGEDFPVPFVDGDSLGELYLRCDGGNPGEIFDSIEAVCNARIFRVRDRKNVKIDNICMKYACFGVSAGGNSVDGLTVTSCEIGWIGGNIQHYLGTDPNYPSGRRGTVTRFGNAIEIYGGCRDYTVEGCYIYQSYDAGITHQKTTVGEPVYMQNILYRGNLIEHCVYSIEYFLEKTGGDTESYMDGIEICHNIMRASGYGWGQQRHNTDTPAHIKGWSYENTARNYVIHDNVFDRAAYRMLHLVAKKSESCPQMYANTYVQTLGAPLGQFGANEQGEPAILPFDEHAADTIRTVFGDRFATVYTLAPSES